MTVFHGADGITLHHGEALGMLRKLPEASVDVVLTDPPYSSGGAFRGDRTATAVSKYVRSEYAPLRNDFAGDNRDQRGYLAWASLWLSECLRVAKPGAIAFVFSD